MLSFCIQASLVASRSIKKENVQKIQKIQKMQYLQNYICSSEGIKYLKQEYTWYGYSILGYFRIQEPKRELDAVPNYLLTQFT